jgi:GTP-dependent phosphoenolpyruvate carboxykinase
MEAEPGESSALVSAPVESERRRACRAVHFCLHTNERGSRADESTGLSREKLRETSGLLSGAMRGRTMFVIPT